MEQPSEAARDYTDHSTTANANGDSDSLDGAGTGGAETAAVQAAPVDELIAVTFEDLSLGMRGNSRYDPKMMKPEVQELFGERIRIAGMMLPDAGLTDITEFILLKFAPRSFGPGGPADELIVVFMNEGRTTEWHDQPVEVTGTLRFNPFEGPDGNTWRIYELHADDVTRVKR